MNNRKNYRYLAFEIYNFEKRCKKCGNVKNLNIHHKDENRKNNKKSNLIVYCRSCHRKHHTIGNKNPMFGIKLTGNKNGMFGRKHSEKTIEKMRNNFIGKNLSKSTRLKISKSLIGNKRCLGKHWQWKIT